MTSQSRANDPPEVAPKRPKKYLVRQAEIIKVAVRLINRRGVKAMTFPEIAAQLGMVPTGINYYFASKEDLVNACHLQAIQTYRDLIAQAAVGGGPADRLKRLISGMTTLFHDIDCGEREPIASFNDIRGQNDRTVIVAYRDMFRDFRALIEPGFMPRAERQGLNILAHMVLSQVIWAQYWLQRYDPEDYGRANARMLDILLHGIALSDAPWEPTPSGPLMVEVARQDAIRESFLLAATTLINEQGYHGASPDKVSARLNVTKGSFYHHIDAKDDLVIACFERTLEIMRRAQTFAAQNSLSGWSQISSAAMALVDHQLTGVAPLLRTSALSAAPEVMKTVLIDRLDRVSLNFGSMICDGVADGSLRPVDTHIAAQMVTCMINSTAELELWSDDLSADLVSAALVRPLFYGLSAFRG